MSDLTDYEQYLLELINSERSKVGLEPLAFNGKLDDAADSHGTWMLATDTFDHTGVNGSDPQVRMETAGYTFGGSSWAFGENIAYYSATDSALSAAVDTLHTNLMNSPEHKANILSSDFKEIGVNFETGEFGNAHVAMTVEDFARSGTGSFLTGVAFSDKDGNAFYDPGEGN